MDRESDSYESVRAKEAANRAMQRIKAPFQAIANLWTSAHFGLTYTPSDYQEAMNLLHAPDKLFALESVQAAEAIAAERRFLHWELTFPEVFFDPVGAPLAEDAQGFDAVIGNPPYGANLQSEDVDYMKSKRIYKLGKPETYLFFTEISIQLASKEGLVGLIIPNAWLTNYYGKQIREFVLERARVLQVVNLEPIGVFQEAIVDTIVIILQRQEGLKSRLEYKIEVREGESPGKLTEPFLIPQSSWMKDDEYLFNIMASAEEIAMMEKMEFVGVTLDELGEYSQGIIPYKTRADAENDPYFSSVQVNDEWKPALESSDAVQRYSVTWERRYLQLW